MLQYRKKWKRNEKVKMKKRENVAPHCTTPFDRRTVVPPLSGDRKAASWAEELPRRREEPEMKEKSESEITVNPTATKKVKVQKNFFLYIFCAHGLLMSLLKRIKTEPMQCIFNFFYCHICHHIFLLVKLRVARIHTKVAIINCWKHVLTLFD